MSEQSPQHFVGYHNIDVQGRPLWRGRDGSFDTNKPVLPKKDDVLWCFEGEGRPKQFRLMKRAVVSHSDKESGGSAVYYDKSDLLDAAVNDLPWFAELRKEQSSFSFGLNRIRNPEIIAALEGFAAGRGRPKVHFTDICAYTLKHSSDLEAFADGGDHSIRTGGKSWARIADLLSEKEAHQSVPVLFAPAEKFVKVTACAELVEVKTLKADGINSFTFTNFRFLSPPVLKSSLKWYNGNPLGDFQRDYAICRTPVDLDRRLILAPTTEANDIAATERDPTIPETTRTALIEARRGQGGFREKLDKRWEESCASPSAASGIYFGLRTSSRGSWRPTRSVLIRRTASCSWQTSISCSTRGTSVSTTMAECWCRRA